MSHANEDQTSATGLIVGRPACPQWCGYHDVADAPDHADHRGRTWHLDLGSTDDTYALTATAHAWEDSVFNVL